MRTSAPERLAAGILALEALALLILAGWEIVALVSGDTDDATSSIALMVLTVLGAVALAAFGVAVARGQSWGRSGGIVAQLLLGAVAFGALSGPAGSPATALALAVPAVVALVVLVAAARRAAARNQEHAD